MGKIVIGLEIHAKLTRFENLLRVASSPLVRTNTQASLIDLGMPAPAGG